ncbi:MAG: hypothetical protein IKZ45_05825 [Fibrobacter sp.]|nr:hypothetical protein [Fibrobacter sp.]
MSRIATFPLVLAAVMAVLLLASCARKEPEVDFKPIQLNWRALSEAAEQHPEKDACVIAITSQIMRAALVRESRFESLDYDVNFNVKGENLEFEGICKNSGAESSAECRFSAVCSGAQNVVVKFHNGD